MQGNTQGAMQGTTQGTMLGGSRPFGSFLLDKFCPGCCSLCILWPDMKTLIYHCFIGAQSSYRTPAHEQQQSNLPAAANAGFPTVCNIRYGPVVWEACRKNRCRETLSLEFFAGHCLSYVLWCTYCKSDSAEHMFQL